MRVVSPRIIHALAPEAELMSIRVLDFELVQQRHQVFHQAALHAIQMGANILNCSFGSPGSSARLPVYKSWPDKAFLANCHVVAASSNSK